MTATRLRREQTRTGSAVEAVANVAIGYTVAVFAQVVIFPLFGIHVPLSTNLAIGACFTAVSIARSYLVRRFFEARMVGSDNRTPEGADHPRAS